MGDKKTLYCTVPMESAEHALDIDHNRPVYKYICGRSAEFRVGGWLMCGKHKTYLADAHGWESTPIEKSAHEKSAYEIAREQAKEELEIMRDVIFSSVIKKGEKPNE